MTAEALKTITSPMNTSSRMTVKSHLSTLTRIAISVGTSGAFCPHAAVASCELPDEVFEDAAAMFVADKLVEAGTGRRQQHDVTAVANSWAWRTALSMVPRVTTERL